MSWWWTERRSRDLQFEFSASILLAIPILVTCGVWPYFAGLCTIASIATTVAATVDSLYYVLVHADRPQGASQIAIAYLFPLLGWLLHVLWIVLCVTRSRVPYVTGFVASLLIVALHAGVALCLPRWPYAITPAEMSISAFAGMVLAAVVVAVV